MNEKIASVEKGGTSDYCDVNCKEEESGIAIRYSLSMLRVMKHWH